MGGESYSYPGTKLAFSFGRTHPPHIPDLKKIARSKSNAESRILALLFWSPKTKRLLWHFAWVANFADSSLFSIDNCNGPMCGRGMGY